MCSLCLIATHLCLALLFVSSGRAAGGSSTEGQNEILVLEGHEADLPCVTTPTHGKATPTGDSRYVLVSNPGDSQRRKYQRPLIIVWYKDGVRSSLYSYDGRNPDHERHWSQRRSLGGPLNLTLPDGPNARPQLAFLRLSHAHHTDAGVYRCRVDFASSPSRVTYTRLSVVAPPNMPTVEMWAAGRWLRTTPETPAAAVEVGNTLRLRCSAAGGRPEPSVTWWRGGKKLLGEIRTQTDLIISSLNVTVLTEDSHSPIVCQASNSDLAPPRRTPLQLLVLSPPSWVRVTGAHTPMSVGGSYVVECRSKGATPPPVLTWTVGGREYAHALATTDSEGETVSRLEYEPRPEHAGAHLTCTARPPEHAHHHRSPYPTPKIWVRTDSVPLNILYKPEVQLQLQRLGSSSSSSRRSKATRPPFSPSLHKAKTHQRAPPSGADASRNHIPSDREDEEEEEETSLAEGEGVVLQCHVRANPPAFHVSWYKDGKPLSPGRNPGLVVGNMSVVLRQLQREDAGSYGCTAHNNQGSSRSPPVPLHVTHGPECLRDTPQVLGVPRHHPLNVTCQVAAHPPPTAFSWALKSSRGLLQVPAEMITSAGTTSWISYTPRAAVDYGELLCWAHTPLGRQRKPCAARLVPADRPDAPEQCEVSRATLRSITVSCTAAHDGGLPQTFFMKVLLSGQEVTNSSSVTSHITAHDLQPDTRYRLTLWSANTHGTSRTTSLFASTAPSNASSASSSRNGHSGGSAGGGGGGGGGGGKGPLAALGPSLLAVVVVVTVLGVVLGVVLGILTQGIALPDRSSSSSPHDDDSDDEEDHPPPTEVPGRQRAPRGRLGRGITGRLRQTPSARCDVVKVARRGVHKPHVYADPRALRRGPAHQATPEEIARVSHNNNNNDRPMFPVAPNAHGLDPESRTISWHLPNSRLLRNKIDLRLPQGEALRKPVKVEPPKLPTSTECTPLTPVARTTPLSSLEFRLILIPETSKMLKYAFERDAAADTRLMPYLPIKESPLSSSPSKFPTITEEEEEYKTLSTNRPNHSCATVTPYESVPVEGEASDARGRTTTLSPIEEHPVEVTKKKSVPQAGPRDASSTYDEVRNASIAFINNCDIQNRREEADNVFCDYSDREAPRTTSIGGTGTTLAIDASRGERQPTGPHRTALDFEQHLYRHCDLRRNSVPNNGLPGRARPSPYDHPRDLTWTPEVRRVVVPLQAVPWRRSSEPSIPLVGKLGRLQQQQPYGAPLDGCLQRSLLHTPTRRQTKPLVVPEGGNSPQTSTPGTSYSGPRRSRVGFTSLFSLSSSVSSSSSSSSSSPSSRWCKRWGKRTSAPRWSLFGSSRPHSVHAIAACGPEQQELQCYVDSECLSSSTHSSPRSSSSSSSSSCFPHSSSSSSSSSPVSSFYSSENSLSISASLSHSSSSSSSSFQFSSSSSSSSATSGSPLSSFLSPSLSSPSSSSFLSLASCSTAQDSILSGQVTPT